MNPTELRELVNSPEIQEKVQKIKDWVLSQSSDSNYMFNLQQVFKAGYLSRKHVGLVASAPHVFVKATAAQIQNEKAKNSQFVGNVGEKITRKVSVSFISSFETAYGVTWMYSMVDEDGNILVWFASRKQELETGSNVEITGTVKKHDVYKEKNQTILTRCKF
jgi:hypothetical protein